MFAKLVLVSILGGTLCLQATTATAASDGQKWACEAKGLKTARYSGGSRAYIHLKPYKKGGDYTVKKNADGTVSGKTANNTPFVCRVKES